MNCINLFFTFDISGIFVYMVDIFSYINSILSKYTLFFENGLQIGLGRGQSKLLVILSKYNTIIRYHIIICFIS